MFNSKPVKVNGDWKDGRKGWDYVGHNGLKSESGDNVIKIIFKRGVPSMMAQAYVRIEVKDVRPQFTECEDKKVCLGERGLGSLWNTQPAKDLRESIKLQWQCLCENDDDSAKAETAKRGEPMMPC